MDNEQLIINNGQFIMNNGRKEDQSNGRPAFLSARLQDSKTARLLAQP